MIMSFLNSLRFMRKNVDSLYRLTTASSKFQTKLYCSKSKESPQEPPIKYLESDAAKWPARASRISDHEPPWYEVPVVSVSLAVFLIYFCILREENDVDLELTKNLDDRIPGIEKHHLLKLHEERLDRGEKVDGIEKRLKEILREERKNKIQS